MFAEVIPAPKPHDPRALNAYRHGLTGQVHILTQDDRVAYDKHCRGIHDALAPSGAMEADRVQSIAPVHCRRPLASQTRRRHRKFHLRHGH